MTSIKDFLEVINYKISEGSDYCWRCYGENSYQIDSISLQEYNINCIFDKEDQTVYALEAWDYRQDRYYRWINPVYLEDFKQECSNRGIDYRNAIDGDNFVDLEVVDDFFEKAKAIINNESYDLRVKVPLTLDRDQMYDLMMMAHEQDITLNQIVEQVLQVVIDKQLLGADTVK